MDGCCESDWGRQGESDGGWGGTEGGREQPAALTGAAAAAVAAR